ncbi:c-type cytochrome [Campylobacter sp. CCS1377]|uniref:C-type cytochrome n=1 Tax=Campylobacter sp. CCS1377 TaxID=3158229 RepID=A0AAU7E9V8_9BACT|nr:c-type cytochrome [Campylobacter jejuni]
MRELKIFLVVVVFTALVYWGVEPYAHSVMKPHVAPANFDFQQEDLSFANSIVATKQADLELAKAENNESKIEAAQKALDLANEKLQKNQALWDKVSKMDFSKADASKGAEFFSSNCIACHGLEAAGIAPTIPDSSIYGVLPPDLSGAGLLYDEKFLAALIMNPSLALKVDHKFGDAFIMTAYNVDVSGESEEVTDANIINVIAYLKEVAMQHKADLEQKTKAELEARYAKIEGISEEQKAALIEKDMVFAKEKNTFIEACGRCHSMKYDGLVATSNSSDLKGYLGSIPPDLSMMIRSRGEEYLNNFLNNTQKLLPGTAMPRVGLNEASQKEILAYMEKIGDSKKEERESTGLYIMLFFVILSIFAIAWKRSVWSKLH